MNSQRDIVGAKSGFSLAKVLILLYVPCISWFGYISGTLVFERIYLALLLLYFLFASFAYRQTIALRLPHILMLLWLFWAVVTSLLAQDATLSLAKVFASFTRFGAALIILSLVIRFSAYTWLVFSFLIAGAGNALFIVLFPGAGVDFGGRVYGTVANANTFGVLMTGCVACALYLLARGKVFEWKKLIYVALLVLFVWMVIQSGSRKAAIGVLTV